MLIALLLSGGVTYFSYKSYGTYYNKIAIVLIFVLLSSIFFLIFKSYKNRYKKIFMGTIVLISFLSGMFINPIQKGLDVVYDNPLSKAIFEINNSEDELWVVEGLSFPIINYPIMMGARTINSTNFYPDNERWRILDKEGKFENIYNRYAHININIVDKKYSIFLENEDRDSFGVDLSVDDLKKLGIKYILTVNSFENMSNEKIIFKERYNDQNFKIYEVIYN